MIEKSKSIYLLCEVERHIDTKYQGELKLIHVLKLLQIQI